RLSLEGSKKQFFCPLRMLVFAPGKFTKALVHRIGTTLTGGQLRSDSIKLALNRRYACGFSRLVDPYLKGAISFIKTLSQLPVTGIGPPLHFLKHPIVGKVCDEIRFLCKPLLQASYQVPASIFAVAELDPKPIKEYRLFVSRQ